MKEKFEKPELIVVSFIDVDIITNSDPFDDDDPDMEVDG